MKDDKIKKIRSVMNEQLNKNGIITVVDTFMGIGILERVDYEKWRKGQIPYLEMVCKGNLSKLSKTLDEIYKYSRELNLKVSYTYYRKYGKGNIKLRFSKFGQESIERRYSNHFLPQKNKSVNKDE